MSAVERTSSAYRMVERTSAPSSGRRAQRCSLPRITNRAMPTLSDSPMARSSNA